jgi:Skp family chaperone for outer membrane proteins
MKKVLGVGLIGLVALLAACGGGQKEEVSTEPKVESRKTGELKITYYDQDSVSKYFEYFRMEDSLIKQKQITFQKEIERRTKNLQDYVVQQERKNQSGLLSQNDLMQVQQTIQKREASLMQYQQEEGSKIEREAIDKMNAINNRVKLFSKEFCETNNIDLLLIYSPMAPINYIDPSMDVTKEFTAYLNQRQNEFQGELTEEK